MADLVFVRHGPTTWSGRRFCGRADPALSRAGARIAERLGAHLAVALSACPAPGPRIVSSPARRARQTAVAISVALRTSRVDVDPRWAEADVGIAEGLTFDALAAIDPGLAARLANGDTAIDWPGGETAASLTERVAAALGDLQGGSLPAIVVSHAGPLRIAVALATNMPPEAVDFLEPGGWLRAPGGPAAVAGPDRMLRFRA